MAFNIESFGEGASFPLSLANGGTGASLTATPGAIVYGTGVGMAFGPVGTSGQVLLSGGTGAYTWGSLPGIIGVLPIANGGTNSSTALNNNRVMVSVGGSIVENTALTGSANMRTTAGGLPTTGPVVLTSEVSGILPIANGGTNSGTALNNNRVMVSVGGAIVEQSALTGSAPMRTNASGLPTTGNTNLVTEVTGTLPLANGGTSASLVATAGAVAYSNATNISFTGVGTSGMKLVSQGTGAPVWGFTTGKVLGVFNTSTARTINNTTPVVVYENVEVDTTGTYNTTTGTWTAPRTDYYTFGFSGETSGSSFVVGSGIFAIIYVNGVSAKSIAVWRGQAVTSSFNAEFTGNGVTIPLTSGDLVTMRIYSDISTTLNASAAKTNYWTVSAA